VPADCITGSTCAGNLCVSVKTSTCTDFVRDGNETDVDCGGSCPPCGDGRGCVVNTDCASNSCGSAGHCVEPNFTPVPTADVYLIDAGAGLVIAPGQQAGYGITVAVGGGSFRLVWTGDGNVTDQYHEFYGSVYTDGTISSVTPGCSGACSFNSSDYLSAVYAVTGGTRVDFDAFNVNDLEGIDFTVTGGANGNGEPVYFDLYVDGQPHPELVFFASGGQTSNAASSPFGLQTH
jgi:hypothetical protein